MHITLLKLFDLLFFLFFFTLFLSHILIHVMQIFATSEKREREGGEIANQLDNKTTEGTKDIMNVFERKNEIICFWIFIFIF